MGNENASASPINELTEQVIGCAHDAHNELGAGFVEKVYENALCIRLREVGIQARQQAALTVKYHGSVVGDFAVDILVEGRLILELKATKQLLTEHEIQLVNYLVASGIDDGLLINFGKSVQVKRKFRSFAPKTS